MHPFNCILSAPALLVVVGKRTAVRVCVHFQDNILASMPLVWVVEQIDYWSVGRRGVSTSASAARLLFGVCTTEKCVWCTSGLFSTYICSYSANHVLWKEAHCRSISFVLYFKC